MSLSTRLRKASLLFSFTVILLVTLIGCAKPVGSVHGTVTYKGKTLKGGSLQFHNADGGKGAGGEIKEDGTFTIEGVEAGTYKVCINTDYLKAQPVFGKAKNIKAEPGKLENLPHEAGSNPRTAQEAKNGKAAIRTSPRATAKPNRQT